MECLSNATLQRTPKPLRASIPNPLLQKSTSSMKIRRKQITRKSSQMHFRWWNAPIATFIANARESPEPWERQSQTLAWSLWTAERGTTESKGGYNKQRRIQKRRQRIKSDKGKGGRSEPRQPWTRSAEPPWWQQLRMAERAEAREVKKTTKTRRRARA
jgi:hypothetical protein